MACERRNNMNFIALLLSILSFLGLTWLFGGGLK
nr:MAG TPA: hypothetical protein [Caudoviricetes sp.]